MARSLRSTPSGRRSASRAADARLKLPVNSLAPAVTGTATEGETLSMSTGTWSNTPDAYARIWKRDGLAIAAGATYVLTEDDVGAVISGSVVATNIGVSAVANSNATDEVAAAE